MKGAINVVSSTDAFVCRELTSRVHARALAQRCCDSEPVIRGVDLTFDLIGDVIRADDLIDWKNDAFAHAPWNAFVDSALIVCALPEAARIHPTTRVAIMRELIRVFTEQRFTVLVTTQDPYVLKALETFCERAGVADSLLATYVTPQPGVRIHYDVNDTTDNLEVIYQTFAEPFQYLEDIELSIRP